MSCTGEPQSPPWIHRSWASWCQHSHQLRKQVFLTANQERTTGGPLTGLQEGFAQDRDFRLRIEFPSAFPGEFLGTEAVGSCLECWWKGEALESVRPFLTAPSPHWAQPPSFTNPTGRGQDSLEFLRKQHKPLTLLPSFSLPVPPWTWFGETSCSQKSSDPPTLRSQTHKTNEEAAVTAKAFGGLPVRSRCPCKWQGSGADRLGSSCLFSGQVFWSFQVSLSLSAK